MQSTPDYDSHQQAKWGEAKAPSWYEVRNVTGSSLHKMCVVMC